MVTVTDCPGEKTAGENVAEVLGGRPVTDGVMSNTVPFCAFTVVPNWIEPEPPNGTLSSRDRGAVRETAGTELALIVSGSISASVC